MSEDPGTRAVVRRDAVVLALLALASFAALAWPERLPSVDLPAHARLLALMVGFPDDQREALGVAANLVAPYWLFHLTALPLTLAFEPYAAVKLALALYVGAIPPAFGVLLAARGSRPLHGVHAVLLSFGAMTAWGLVGIVAGIPVFALALAVAERLAAAPTRRRALALAALVGMLYLAHPFVFAAGVAGIVLVLAGRGVPRIHLAPLVGAVTVACGLLLVYRLTFESTPYMRAIDEQASSLFAPDLSRLLDVVTDAASYGPRELRGSLAIALFGALGAHVLLGLRERLPGTGLAPRYALAAVASLVLVVTVTPRAYLLPPRFGFLATAFLIVAAPVVAGSVGRIARAVSVVLAFLVTGSAAAAGWEFSERTRCLAEVAERMDAPGRTLTLVFRGTPRGYRLPVLDHVGLYLAARRGGVPFHETYHTGAHPLRARDVRSLPDRDTMLLHAFPMRYSPDRARNYDTIVTVPRVPSAVLLGDEAPRFAESTCGDYLLLQRRRGS